MRSTARSRRSSAPMTSPSGKGAININVLWEMGGAQRVLHGVLERTKGLVTGVTCGAGMPYKLSARSPRPTASIICRSSARRAPSARCGSAPITRPPNGSRPWSMKTRGWPAGTTAFSNAEDPRKPQDPYPRVKALRDTMREQGIADSVPIVMAGGVWRLDEWDNWIDNPELGQIVFQFGTRPLLTQESPIPPEWKARLMTLEEGDILLHRFSPTGFYSSAVRNPFLREPRSAQRAPDRLHQGADRRPPFRARRRHRHQEELLGHQGRSAARARMVSRAASPTR